jgi:integrase
LAQIQQKQRQQANGEKPAITVDDAFGRYYYEKGQYLSLPNQRLTRLNILKQEFNVQYLHEITAQEVSAFIVNQRKTLSNATINRYLFLLSAVLKTAREEWKVKTSDIKPSSFKLKEPAENIKYLKDWTIAQKIIDRSAPHLRPIIYTALYTGMRLGNILTLKWENLDFISNTINIKVKDRTKEGGKNLSIPMIPQLSEILQSQPHINDYVFNFNGKPIQSIKTAWRNIFYCRDANGVFTKKLKDESLPYVNFHTLRHTAATWILQKTNNLRITKEILGHANINTTLKYAHVLDEEKRNALTSVFK